jgi:hypothetical protein
LNDTNKFTFVFIVCILIFCNINIQAQGVAINTTGTAPSTMLHVAQTNGSNNILEILRIDRSNAAAPGGNSIGVSCGRRFYYYITYRKYNNRPDLHHQKNLMRVVIMLPLMAMELKPLMELQLSI